MPAELASKIAAGEVVQRPSSVVKELVDNALDAGARNIDVIIEKAGKSLIHVIDDGSGMSPADIKMSVEPHATSKLREIGDLYRIRSYGFRGEALSAIASVSQVEINSRMKGETSGWKLEVWGSEQKPVEPCPMKEGSSIKVANLFYNVPARRSFLKTNQTELRHIISALQNISLANPEIGFHLFVDGQSYIELPGGSLEDRIIRWFGKDYRASLIPISQKTDQLRISGFIIDPLMSKKTRGEQFLFVNKRPFQHRFLIRIMMEEYEPWLRPEEYPFFALFFETDPEHVDVNVHPSKLEVKFDDERSLMTFTRSAVRKALGERFSIPAHDAFKNLESLGSPNNPFENSPFVGGESHFNAPSRINLPQVPGQSLTETLYGEAYFSSKPRFHQQSPDQSYEIPVYPIEGSRGFWQLHGRYIISQTLSGLCVIDQVYAHRRIVYERVLKSSESQLPSTQQLLFPQTLEFSASDFELLKDLLSIVERMGFSVELLSGKTAVLSGVPADLETGDEKDLLHSILRQFQDINDQSIRDPRQKLAIAIAQRLSIKGGKKLGEREMEHLVDELFSCDKPYVDPLNRPTIAYISLEELATRFR